MENVIELSLYLGQIIHISVHSNPLTHFESNVFKTVLEKMEKAKTKAHIWLGDERTYAYTY